jgi:hypothetical protein
LNIIIPGVEFVFGEYSKESLKLMCMGIYTVSLLGSVSNYGWVSLNTIKLIEQSQAPKNVSRVSEVHNMKSSLQVPSNDQWKRLTLGPFRERGCVYFIRIGSHSTQHFHWYNISTRMVSAVETKIMLTKNLEIDKGYTLTYTICSETWRVLL